MRKEKTIEVSSEDIEPLKNRYSDLEESKNEIIVSKRVQVEEEDIILNDPEDDEEDFQEDDDDLDEDCDDDDDFEDDDDEGDTDSEEEIDLEDKSTTALKAFDYYYHRHCKTCRLAVNDPNIHNIFRNSGENVQEVRRYLMKKYPDPNLYPSTPALTKHMKKHFMPLENTNKIRLKNYDIKIREEMELIKDAETRDEIDRLKAIINKKMYNLELLNDTMKDKRAIMDIERTVIQYIKVYSELITKKDKLLQNELTVDDINKSISEYCENWISNILSNDPVKGREVISIMVKHRPNPPKFN